MKSKIYVFALLSIFFILVFTSSLQNSGTCDEIAHHIPVGYVLLTKWDFKMDTSQPPLPRYILALPLKLFTKVNMPDDKNAWRVEDRSIFGRNFFFKYNNDPKKMILLCRIPVMVIGVLCGILLFVWGRSLYGERAALLSLFLYSFSPNILAHAGLATTDMIATFFIFLSVYSFWLFLCDTSFKKMLFAGFCLGLAQISKYNAILLYPIFLLLLFFDRPRILRGKARILSKFALVVCISVIVIWMGYGFDFQPILKDAMRTQEKIDIAHDVVRKYIPHITDFRKIDDFLLNTPLPLGPHILGMMGVYRHVQKGHNAYFLGRWSSHGNVLYFLIAFLIKNTIPMLIFFIAGLLITIKRHIERAEKLIFLIVLIFFVASSIGNLQIGLRHILPLYPLCFLVAGRSEALFKKNFVGVAVCSLIIWHAASAFWIWPHYFGYFNEFIGGSKNGYKILRDSNLDWGQDLPALSNYMTRHKIDEVALEYFGESDPAIYGIRYRKFQDGELLKPGVYVYAISAQYLDQAKWAKDYKPDAVAGSSIFIYDFTKKDLR